VMKFYRRGQDALDADAVTTHDYGYLLAVGVQDRRAHGYAVFRPELEDVADFQGFRDAQHTVAFRAALSFGHGAQVGPLNVLDVAGDVDAALVMVVNVRAGGHIGAPLQGVIGKDFVSGHADSAEAPGVRAHRLENLLRMRRAQRRQFGAFRA